MSFNPEDNQIGTEPIYSKNVCMRLTDADESMKFGVLELRKGPPHVLSWTPHLPEDQQLYLSFNLNDLKSFSRVVPIHGSTPYMTFSLKDNTRTWPLEFPSGGTRELIRSFQGILEYKRSEKNQNEYIVCETSDEVVWRAMETLNLFEGASLECMTPQLSMPRYPGARQSRTGILQQAKDGAQKGIITFGRLVREAVVGGDRTDYKSGVEDMKLSKLREEDVNVYSSFREDCGFEVLTKKPSLTLVPRPKVTRNEAPVTTAEWKTHLDALGRVTSVDALMERIFRAGLEQSIRPTVWKYLLKYFDWTKTEAENEKLAERKKDEYFAMKYQWKSITDEQLKRNSIMRDRINQVEKDVKRTDRSMDFFKDEESDNMKKLNDILMTYTMYNFDLGYVQGMSDLLSPILILMGAEDVAFWCFAGLMDRVEHNFELDQAGMKKQLQQLSSLTQCLDEQLFDHLEEADSSNMYFAFRWVLLHFKREFAPDEVMKLFEVLWTDLPCPNFHLLICLAILDGEREAILQEMNDLTTILKHINEMAMRIDLERCLCVAEGIYLQMRNCNDLPDDIADIFGLHSDSCTTNSDAL